MDPFIVWVVPLGIKALNGAVSVLGCTSRAADDCSTETTPLIFHKLPTSEGEGEGGGGKKLGEKMSPEKAKGNVCCNICQGVVTCWCWNTTGSKFLLLFKCLVTLI